MSSCRATNAKAFPSDADKDVAIVVLLESVAALVDERLDDD